MSIETSLDTYLISCSAITSKVSNRIYPLIAPQNVVKPYLTYQKISDIPTYSHSGNSNLNATRIQINIYATTYLQITEITAILTVVMDNWNNVVCFKENEMDDYDNETKVFSRNFDFIIYHNF